jgi:hypothetical protein
MRRTILSFLSDRPVLITLAFLSALALPRPAAAQEIQISGPLQDCILLLVHDTVPAAAETSWWLTGGGGVRLADGGSDGLGILGAGAEVTVGLTTFGSPRRYGGPVELRWGPWAGGLTDLGGVRVEGGLLMSVGQVRHAQWGTYALRIGGGFGDDGLGLAPHAVVTLTGGVRYVGARFHPRGACDPPAAQEPDAFATGARLFGSARAALEGEGLWQLTFGIELEPTFFFPPYSLGKWIGSGP